MRYTDVMVSAKKLAAAEAAVHEHGALLVYPEAGRAEPRALWHVLYPRTELDWRWDGDADPRVAELWHVREQLCHRRSLVYSKWYRGRAAFFSPALFTSLLRVRRAESPRPSRDAEELLGALRDDSPQSTKLLRRSQGLMGKAGERVFTGALRELWEGMLIVGTGEVPDGAFPSLALAATELWFEPLWEAASSPPRADDHSRIGAAFPPKSPWARSFAKLRRAGELPRGAR
jgi:hypothetical protein